MTSWTACGLDFDFVAFVRSLDNVLGGSDKKETFISMFVNPNGYRSLRYVDDLFRCDCIIREVESVNGFGV